MTRSDWLEEATAQALDAARAKARTQGREPTAAEFAAAINGVGEPPKRQRRHLPKGEPHDSRDFYFSLWLDHIVDEHWMAKIEESPGGFDAGYFAQKMIQDGCCNENDCRAAIDKARAAIALIESVLAEVEKQKKEAAGG
jgi:hypothetical protein